MVNLIMELTQPGRCFRKKPAGCVQGDSGDQGTKLKMVAAQPQVWQMGWREVMRTHSAPPAWIPRPAPHTHAPTCVRTHHTRAGRIRTCPWTHQGVFLTGEWVVCTPSVACGLSSTFLPGVDFPCGPAEWHWLEMSPSLSD